MVRNGAKPALYKESLAFLNIEHSQLPCAIQLFLSGWLFVTVSVSAPPTLVFRVIPPPPPMKGILASGKS